MVGAAVVTGCAGEGKAIGFLSGCVGDEFGVEGCEGFHLGYYFIEGEPMVGCTGSMGRREEG